MPQTKKDRVAYYKEYRENNKVKIAKANKEYYQNNKHLPSVNRSEYRENNKEKRAKEQREYNKTPAGIKSGRIGGWRSRGVIDTDFDALYDYYSKQTHCMICAKEFKNSRDRNLEHDHDDGSVRYICCQNCNLWVVG